MFSEKATKIGLSIMYGADRNSENKGPSEFVFIYQNTF